PFGRFERAVICWPQLAAASRSPCGSDSGSSCTTVAARFSTRTLPSRSSTSPRGACTCSSRTRLSRACCRYWSPDNTCRYLQVLSGDQYLQQARDNRVRELQVQAPRGDVLDRDGNVLVENRAATVVQLDPESLPQGERDAAANWGQQMTARSKRPKG